MFHSTLKRSLWRRDSRRCRRPITTQISTGLYIYNTTENKRYDIRRSTPFIGHYVTNCRLRVARCVWRHQFMRTLSRTCPDCQHFITGGSEVIMTHLHWTEYRKSSRVLKIDISSAIVVNKNKNKNKLGGKYPERVQLTAKVPTLVNTCHTY